MTESKVKFSEAEIALKQLEKSGFKFERKNETYVCELPKCNSVLKIGSFNIKDVTGDLVYYDSKRTFEDMGRDKDELVCSICNANISGNVYLNPLFPAWFHAYFGGQRCELCVDTTNYTKITDNVYSREPEINPIGKKIFMVLDTKNADEYTSRTISVYYKEGEHVRGLIFSDNVFQLDRGVTSYMEKYESVESVVGGVEHAVKTLTEYMAL